MSLVDKCMAVRFFVCGDYLNILIEIRNFSDNVMITENLLFLVFSFLVLTECLSRRSLRFRTSVIDLIHSERVSTSISFFFAFRLTYSSNASMIMSKFECHEYETVSMYFWSLLKISLSIIIHTKLRSTLTKWPHGAYRNCESEQLQGWDHGRDRGSRVAASLLYNWRFWKQLNKYTYDDSLC